MDQQLYPETEAFLAFMPHYPNMIDAYAEQAMAIDEADAYELTFYPDSPYLAY
jgi:hypothetical protein